MEQSRTRVNARDRERETKAIRELGRKGKGEAGKRRGRDATEEAAFPISSFAATPSTTSETRRGKITGERELRYKEGTVRLQGRTS